MIPVSTIHENYEGFMKIYIKKSKDVINLMDIVDNPFERDFNRMLDANTLQNFPITVKCIDNTNKIFDLDLVVIRGNKLGVRR